MRSLSLESAAPATTADALANGTSVFVSLVEMVVVVVAVVVLGEEWATATLCLSSKLGRYQAR